MQKVGLHRKGGLSGASKSRFLHFICHNPKRPTRHSSVCFKSVLDGQKDFNVKGHVQL